MPASYCFTARAGFRPPQRTTLSSWSQGSPTCCNDPARKDPSAQCPDPASDRPGQFEPNPGLLPGLGVRGGCAQPLALVIILAVWWLGAWRLKGRLPGVTVAPSTVWEILRAAGINPAPRRSGPSWRQFLHAQAAGIVAVDFLHVDTVLLRLKLVGQRERLLQVGPDLDAGADLLVKDLVALRPAEGFELARQLLAGGRRPRVPVPRRPLGPRRRDHGKRGALLPRPAGATVGGHRHFEFLRSAGTRTKRVWYVAAIFPPRVRQALPAGALQFGQS